MTEFKGNDWSQLTYRQVKSQLESYNESYSARQAALKPEAVQLVEDNK